MKKYSVQALIPEPTQKMQQEIMGGNWMAWRQDCTLRGNELIVALADRSHCSFEIESGVRRR